ncbi:prolyl oligopeptidase family serine peptidase [Neptuniibacter sp. PT8_73]|uniref:S9 family peptidase n=1 Tax=Neptuniibacter sp. PT8_73 TaxID=3398206 RepID=UPI0039F49B46
MPNSNSPGFWSSSLSEADAISAGVEYSQLQLSQTGDLYWVEQRPNEGGRCCICFELESQPGVHREITPPDYSVQSKVYEYGGRGWCLLDDALVFVNASDQQVYRQGLSGACDVIQVTSQSNTRYIEPIWDKSRNRLIAVEEIHADAGVINRIVAISLSDGSVEVLVEGADFYSYPVINPQGSVLAFVSWNHPHQPWTSTLFSYLDLTSSELDGPTPIAGHNSEEALSQPYFSEGGELYVVTDRSGWWNIYRCDLDNHDLVSVEKESCDIISAPWQSGLTHYAEIASKIVSIHHKHEGAEVMLEGVSLVPEFNYFKSLVAAGDWVCVVAAAKDRLVSVVKVNTVTGQVRVVTGGASPLLREDCSLAKPMSFSETSSTCYGYFYSPANSQFSNGDGRTPLVVFLHGGPTAATYPVLNMKIQYWTQRGFSVLDLNYRGSSNYGRAYRNSLQHQWGVVEVEDIKSAIDELVELGFVDKGAVFVRGNSSGGFSALSAVYRLDCFAAAASLYGVTDPLVLDGCTHKFESNYLHWLIGDPVAEKSVYRDRAPLDNVDQINCPVIFFQGEKDRVVLPEQTREMERALKERGVRVEAYYFSEEAHGFRVSDTAEVVLREELRFYQAEIPVRLG